MLRKHLGAEFSSAFLSPLLCICLLSLPEAFSLKNSQKWSRHPPGAKHWPTINYNTQKASTNKNRLVITGRLLTHFSFWLLITQPRGRVLVEFPRHRFSLRPWETPSFCFKAFRNFFWYFVAPSSLIILCCNYTFLLREQ